MNEIERICVFFSVGNDLAKVVRTVRARHPHSHITATAPPGFPMDGVAADKIVLMEVSRYRPWHVARVRRLARQLREGRYDLFVVLFPSMKLKMLASLSGAPQCECWGVDGRVHRLDRSFWGNVSGEIPRRLRGFRQFLDVWAQTLLRPVRKHGR